MQSVKMTNFQEVGGAGIHLCCPKNCLLMARFSFHSSYSVSRVEPTVTLQRDPGAPFLLPSSRGADFLGPQPTLSWMSSSLKPSQMAGQVLVITHILLFCTSEQVAMDDI